MIERMRGTIRIRGVNPFVLIPAPSAERLSLGGKGPLPVRFRINGRPRIPWRLNLMPSGDGTFYLYLNGEIRSITGTEVGDEVRIELVRDARYRGGPIQRVPQGLVAGLRSRASAARRWNGLSPSLKKEVVRYLARLKSPEARERNIVRALRVLSGSSERFLGRQWNERPEVKPAGRPRGGGPDPVSAPRPGGRARARPRPPD